MKSHYKGEFNMAALLRSKPADDEEDEDDKWTLAVTIRIHNVKS